MNLENLTNDVDLEVDVNNLKFILKKYISVILISTLVASLIGYVRAKRLPKIWQGQFQIVLSSNTKGGSTSDIESNLKSLLGKKSSSTDLATQLEIMSSPLVLIPAYESILDSEEFKILNIKDLSFGEIKSNLKSKFKDGTKVLNITFDLSLIHI